MSSQTMLCTPRRDVRPVPASGSKGFSLSTHSPNNSEFTLKGYLIRYLSLGKEKYRVDGRTYYLEAGQYLILNPGDIIYTVEENAQGIWAEIPKSYLNRELAVLSSKDEKAWDGLMAGDTPQLDMCDHVYLASMDQLGQLLIGWKEASTFEDDSLSQLTQALLESQRIVFDKIGRLTSAKLSTRKELYRRLCQAQAYIHGNLDSPLDLDTLSQVACLSKYHFIRLFKEVYGETPRQYLIKQRLDRAKLLLISSKKTFHEICHEVGLKDSSSFGRLFKRSFGATPQIFRQMHAMG